MANKANTRMKTVYEDKIEWKNSAGKLHREDGPAQEYANGDKQYWLNNQWFTDISNDDEWLIRQIIE